MAVMMATATGEEHGLMKKLANSSPGNDFKHMKPEHKSAAQKQQKEDNRMVKARYLNHQESENGKLEKPYCKYAGDPILIYKFLAGREYELPKGLVDEVNSTFQARRSEAVDKKGEPIQKDRAPQRIHEFVPIGF